MAELNHILIFAVPSRLAILAAAVNHEDLKKALSTNFCVDSLGQPRSAPLPAVDRQFSRGSNCSMGLGDANRAFCFVRGSACLSHSSGWPPWSYTHQGSVRNGPYWPILTDGQKGEREEEDRPEWSNKKASESRARGDFIRTIYPKGWTRIVCSGRAHTASTSSGAQ